jgi:lysophospholipase L1-like esterase
MTTTRNGVIGRMRYIKLNAFALIFAAIVVAASTTARAAGPATGPAASPMRVALVGDSTVTDHAGWGGAFADLVVDEDEVDCINLSRGGRSSGSFIAEGRWKKCVELKPKYILIQFGHNDEPGHGADREADASTTYRQHITQYVDEARAAGATPILVTSLARRQFGPDGKIHSTLEPYVATVRAIAQERHVPLLDLHARSIELYEKLGPDGCRALSPKKSDGSYDGTHLNATGAAAVAALVVEELNHAVPELGMYFE